MNTEFLRSLQAQILGNEECLPYIITNDMPRVPGEEAVKRDKAIAEIISRGRTKRTSYMITERGVRAILPIADGALFIRTLRQLQTATEMPAWLSAALDGIADEETKWAYLDTLQCGYPWLQGDGLDVGDETLRMLLDLLARGLPSLERGVSMLKKLGEEDDAVTAADVSRALRGPWGDE